MNTFLPYKDFTESAKCLDYKRLGKQRIEAWQIYLALTKKDYGWKQHPIVKMWEGYELALLSYGLAICFEWKEKGYKDTIYDRFLNYILKITNNRITEIKHRIFYNSLIKIIKLPNWLGDKKFHASMRSRLLLKGKCDVLCLAIKKNLKIKSIDKWLIQNSFHKKNELTSQEAKQLTKFIKLHNWKVEKNHYKQFAWKEQDNLPYLWTIKHNKEEEIDGNG